MPYTPPSQRSPVASESTTPAYALSSSPPKEQATAPSPHPTFRPALPSSSSSYLNRHRRSPSLNKPTASFAVGPSDQKDGTAKESTTPGGAKPSVCVTASDKNQKSPPHLSSQNSSDEEDHAKRRGIKDPVNLAELQAAIKLIEQIKESSPERVSEERIKARVTLGLGLPRIDRHAKEHAANPSFKCPLPLSATARKISHSRSSTDMSALLDIPHSEVDALTRSASESDLDELDDDMDRVRPIPVRKKSGELVKPALMKGGLRRRPSSMPGTPTYAKAVHFDPSSLENIRTFSGNDRPIVVSAGTSPAEPYASEIEFPFGADPAEGREPAYEWEIRLSNFPRETLERKLAPVRVERIYLSSDNKNLMGAIAVANLAFHKKVVARFTLDYWKTTSEVVADFNNDVRRKQTEDGCDRFVFSVKLEDQANLESKTLFFCVRYSVNGREFWDNNNSINYQVDFAKKPKATKQGTQGNSRPLPRSNPSHSTSSVRPRSFPSALDDFGYFDSAFQPPSSKPPDQIIGDSPIRFRSQRPAQELAADAPAQRNNGSSQAFGSRYNFGVSLHNAIAAASPTLGERGDPDYTNSEKVAPTQKMSFTKQPIVESGSVPFAKAADGSTTKPKVAGSGASSEEKPKPAALTAEKPSLQSKSYQELLNSYCFYGSSKHSQKAPAAAPIKTQPSAQVDGAADESLVPDPDTKAEAETEPEPEPEFRFNQSTSLVKEEELTLSPRSKPPPAADESKTAPRMTSPRLSRSHSPTTWSGHGSQATSPISFGYPYTQLMQNGFFAESHAPTAIRG
ncbi:MAG: hypothetical protein LQ341_004859 [Variospora aurantia]|nr:MAG: hypothetical protein LQ341_004859 [Variospora aurantia]